MESSNSKKTLLEIQAEQEREQRQTQLRQYRQAGRDGGNGPYNASNGRNGNVMGAGGRNSSYYRQNDGGNDNNRFNRQNDGRNDNNRYDRQNDGGNDSNRYSSDSNGVERRGRGGGVGGRRVGDQGGYNDCGSGQVNSGRRTVGIDNNSGGTSFNRRGGGRGSGGGYGGSNNKFSNTNSNTELEEGVICSLKEGFGFINCADRPDQVFFHFSELQDGLTGADMKINDEVQFAINSSAASRNGSSTNEKKLVAVTVSRIPGGKKIVWNHPDTTMVYPVRGIVDKVPSSIANQSSLKGLSKNNDSASDGLIRILPANFDASKVIEQETQKQESDMIMVRFVPDQYDPKNKRQLTDDEQKQVEETTTNNNSSFSDTFKHSSHPGSGRVPTVLSKGDIVEISQIVIDRRTKERYAKKIAMVESERQRNFQEQEAKLLATATEEVGIVTAVKGEYGFLKSNQRHEEIYFHFSNIHDDESKIVRNFTDENINPFKEGQEMKFLVVTESDNADDLVGRSSLPRRVSARQIQLQPAGSVRWHDVVAKGVTGVVVECPQPIDSGHPLETQGKVRLQTPIKIKKRHTLDEALDEEEQKRNGAFVLNTNKDDDEYVMCSEVYIWSKDSPGGNYSYRGGSSVGLYIQNGDTLLFDVIRDFIGDGGTFRAAPTRYLLPREEEQEESHLEPDEPQGDTTKTIRLVDLSLAGRAEGVVSALKDNNAYGFLQFAERNVDVHFKSYQILPDNLQADLRRNMGLPELLQMDVGTEVQFDISVHGIIAAHAPKQGPPSSNSKNNKNKRAIVQQDRENLKAQRILFLPPGTISQSFTLAKSAKGRIIKQEQLQIFVGTIELDVPLVSKSLEERHPLVAKMVHGLLNNPFDSKILFHDVQSQKEADVIEKLVEIIGKGTLRFSIVEKSNFGGLVCIEKASVGATETKNAASGGEDTIADIVPNLAAGDEDEVADQDDLRSHDELESNDGNSTDGISKIGKKQSSKQKTIKTVRFDKSSLLEVENDTMPPSLDDIVTFDAIQIRRNGHIAVSNLAILERHVPEIVNTGIEALGVIKEMISNRNLAFVSVPDKKLEVPELLSVTLSDISMTNSNIKQLQKGDIIKFIIGKDAKNGKHYVLEAAFQEAKDVKVSTKTTETNPCKGIVLLKLTKNVIVKNNEIEKKKIDSPATISTTVQPNSTEKKSRWDLVTKADDTRIESNEFGCILLTEDTGALFKSSDSNTIDTEGSNDGNSTQSRLYFKRSQMANLMQSESQYPQRGDLVSFNKSRTANGVRDIRIVTRSAATLIRGTLECVQKDNKTAKFIVASESEIKQSYDVDLNDVISCDVKHVKEKEIVEGILCNDQVYGICRYTDLYVDSKIKITKTTVTTERTKLNLTVKKDRGGTIVAQSRMAKGPDSTAKGFPRGWTKRLSAFSEEFVPPTDST